MSIDCIFLYTFMRVGCSNFVSMDGIWKLRFPHCMYPVKTVISGLPAVNYPDVCPKEPTSRTSAFCEEHCEVAKTNNVPTGLRAFLHDYCGVPIKEGKYYSFLIK